MTLDDTDRRLIQLVLEDASRSLRDLAEEAGVTAPTVSARLDRLVDLGVLGPVRQQADLAQLGTLVLILAPPEDEDALIAHDRVFEVHRTQQNRYAALALLPDDDLTPLHQAFEQAETHVLTDRVASQAPTVPEGPGKVPCSQCGKTVDEDATRLQLGGRSYVVCCSSCKQLLEQRYERHELGT